MSEEDFLVRDREGNIIDLKELWRYEARRLAIEHLNYTKNYKIIDGVFYDFNNES